MSIRVSYSCVQGTDCATSEAKGRKFSARDSKGQARGHNCNP